MCDADGDKKYNNLDTPGCYGLTTQGLGELLPTCIIIITVQSIIYYSLLKTLIKGFDPTPVHSGNKLDGFAHFVHTGKCILDKSMHYR